MNKIVFENGNIINILYNLLAKEDQKALRLSTSYLSSIIGLKHFKDCKVNVQSIVGSYHGHHIAYKAFIKKYKSIINICHIGTIQKLRHIKVYPTIWSTLHTLEFTSDFKEELGKNILPKSLHTLKFSLLGIFNQPLNERVLPNLLHTLQLSGSFNKMIHKNVLPASLHTLIFGLMYDQPINEHVLPLKLHTLEFAFLGHFNQPLKKHVLPNTLHTLCFGKYYKQLLTEDVLPESLRILNCDYRAATQNIIKSEQYSELRIWQPWQHIIAQYY